MIAELANVVSPEREISDLEELQSRYQRLFEREGILKTGYEYDLRLRGNAKPFAPPARRLPPAVHERVKKELDRMSEMGVIRKIDEPIDFCSPMVVTYKQTGDLRICADLRKLNESVMREPMQIPTFEELRSKLQDPKIFSHLDMRHGFWQIPVSEEMQRFLSFFTPFGNYYYTCLCFGISSAPEIYTKIMTNLLSGIPNLLIYIDDIVIATSTMEEHKKTLEEVFDRLDKAGLGLNKEKCHIGKESVQFLGHVWSAAGVKPNPSKVRALRDMPLPDSIQSLHSFLGLAAYVGQHSVPHYSTLCSPLWEMVKENSLDWTESRRDSFHTLREALAKDATLAYFDPNEPTVVQTDASGTGLGGVLLQNNKPVLYISRTLTYTERRYSQIEREFLAIVFCMKRLNKYMYLIGLRFELGTGPYRPIINPCSRYSRSQSTAFPTDFRDGLLLYNTWTSPFLIFLAKRMFSRTASLAILSTCLLYTSPSPRDLSTSRMPSSA